jgi:hypothetical protein
MPIELYILLRRVRTHFGFLNNLLGLDLALTMVIGANSVMIKDSGSQFSDEETVRRRDEAIRRALNTPPKPHKESGGKSEDAKARRKNRVKKAVRLRPNLPDLHTAAFKPLV